MDATQRTLNYLAQTGRKTLTKKQARQLRRKNFNSTRTSRHIRAHQDAVMEAASIGKVHHG